jgi:flavin-dependent dehydrogenase
MRLPRRIASERENGLSRRFDVIVVGGGPAGAAAGIACQRQGLNALILEEHDCETVSLVPGETMHPGMQSLFRTLGVDTTIDKAGFTRHTGHFITSQGLRTFHPFGFENGEPWRGYLVDRPRLHRILLDAAEQSGAQVLKEVRAIRPLQDDGRLNGVITTAGRFESHYVFDASGSRQWLVRHLGLSCHEVSPRLIARFGWFKPHPSPAGELATPEFRFNDCEWEWTAPIRPDCHSWVRLALDNPHSRTDPGAACLSGSGTSIGAVGAREVTWKIVPACAGPGYFIIGDAAWILDPACSHGLLKATLSAMLAADAAASALGSSEGNSKEYAYCAWMRDWFCSDAAALITLYSRSPRPASWLEMAEDRLRYIAMIPSFQAFSMRPM